MGTQVMDHHKWTQTIDCVCSRTSQDFSSWEQQASDAAQSNHETADKSAFEGVSHPQYRLLGDACVHGLMVGEARDELDKGKCERFAII